MARKRSGRDELDLHEYLIESIVSMSGTPEGLPPDTSLLLAGRLSVARITDLALRVARLEEALGIWRRPATPRKRKRAAKKRPA